MKRRDFLALLLQGALLAALPSGALAAATTPSPLRKEVQALAAGRRFYRRIATTFLSRQKLTAEQCLEQLQQRLWAEAPADVTADEVARQLQRAVKEDFLAGDVVEIQGWMLARTEVLLCACLQLQASSRSPLPAR